MNTQNPCPCCSESLLRHIAHNRVYWFCPHCRLEMPNLEASVMSQARAIAPRTLELAS
jgi:ribosomal protein L37AE/L43A